MMKGRKNEEVTGADEQFPQRFQDSDMAKALAMAPCHGAPIDAGPALPW